MPTSLAGRYWLRVFLVLATLSSLFGPTSFSVAAPVAAATDVSLVQVQPMKIAPPLSQKRLAASAPHRVSPVAQAKPPAIPLAPICLSPNAPINDGVTFTSTLNAAQSGNLLDLDVSLSATHTYINDLEITLAHNSTSVSLLFWPEDSNGNFCDSNNLSNITLDSDTGGSPGTSVQTSCASGDNNLAFVFGGSYTPDASLNAFDGNDLNGNWFLIVKDVAPPDVGVLQQWCIIPTVSAAAPAISITPTSLVQTQPANVVQTRALTITNVGTGSMNWSAYKDGSVPYCDGASALTWVDITPTIGVLGNGNSIATSVTFTSNVAPGTYYGALCIPNDDAGNPLVTVPLTLNVTPPPMAAIVLTKTVGTTPNTCAATNFITTTSPTSVTYCYRVQNTGNVTMTTHSLWDSRLGTISNTASATLAPNAIITVLRNTSLSGVGYITNTAVWTATNGVSTTTANATATVYLSPAPSIILTKTVGTTPNTCATTNNISVFNPANVTYCYRVRNTGNVTLTTHTLVDSQLGTLSNSVPSTLAPGGIITVLQSTNLIAPGVVVNTAVWTATDTSLYTATASSLATVTVVAPNAAISLVKTVGLNPAQCAGASTISVVGQTDVTYCYTVQNTGNVTLTNHSLIDSPLGLIPVSNYTLAPGASTFITYNATVAVTTTNTAIWTAGNGTYTATSAPAFATVNVIPANPAIVLTKTVQLGAGCAASAQAIATTTYGAAATYCFRVRNTGNYTLTSHTLRDGHLGTISNTVPFTLAPGAIITVQQSFTIAQSITSTAVWTGTRSIYSAVDSDTTMVSLFVTPTAAYAATSYNLTLNPGATTNRSFFITNTQLGTTLTWGLAEDYGSAPDPDFVAVPLPQGGDRLHPVEPTFTAPQKLVAPNVPAVQAGLTEDFNSVPNLPALGWVMQNQSDPLGITGWAQGNTSIFTAQQGISNTYIYANYNNTTGNNTISNWLLTPEIVLQNGATLVFYTRVPTTVNYADRMQVWLSTNGDSTHVGTTATSTGDFNHQLLDINPSYVLTGPTSYPNTWTAFTVTITNVAALTTGRIAFRYFVTNGGPNGSHSNYIGIDSVRYTQPAVNCSSPTDIPWLTVAPTSGSLAGGRSANPTLTFDATGLTPGATFTGKLCLTTNDPLRLLTSIPVTLNVPATNGFSVTVDANVKSVNVGRTVTYTLRITNTGATADTFNLALTNTPLFATTFPASTASVNAGNATSVVVTVTVPAGASAVDVSYAVLAITSQASTINKTVTLTTVGTLIRTYLPFTKK